ncbi:MAG: amidohydrolase family protein, partial [Gaiellaceae bacterium]
LSRPYGLDELRPSLAAHGVDGVVLVQTHSSLEETRRFLALAEADELVAGVVGWADLTAPDLATLLAELGESPYLVGVRHHVHDEPDPAWLLRDDVLRGLAAVRDAGLVYDLLVRPRELPAALEVAHRLPKLRLVIDHAAKPPVATGELEPWRTLVAPFAALEQVSCKVSGLVTEADWERWEPDDLVPYVTHLVEWFGTERLLFGSDWPVCLLAASYDEVYAAYEHALGDLAPLGKTAARVYRPPCAPSSQTRA